MIIRMVKKLFCSLFLFVILLSIPACQVLPDQFIDLFSSITGVQDHLKLGQAAFDKQDYDKAISESTMAAEGTPQDAYIYYLRGQAYYFRYKTLYDAHDPKADGYDFYRAATDFTKAIELSNNYAEAYNFRGLVYAGLELNEHALADYNEAIKQSPNLATTYYGRGYLYETLGERDKAIADYTQYLKLSDDAFWCAESEKRLKDLQNQ